MLLPEEESGRSKSESHQVDYLSWTEELLVVVDMSAARTSRRCPGTVLSQLLPTKVSLLLIAPLSLPLHRGPRTLNHRCRSTLSTQLT